MCITDQLMGLLRDAIERSPLTQEEIAKQAGISKGIISRLVRGERTVGDDTAQKIADMLGYEIRASVKLVRKPSPRGSKKEKRQANEP